MQQIHYDHCPLCTHEFQYPQADRRGCNWGRHLAGGSRPWFQYPQADRRGCNVRRIIAPTALPHVSVSTSGSKGVQLSGFIYGDMVIFGFSIHKRIEGGATSRIFETHTPSLSFSIHKRIEGGATSFCTHSMLTYSIVSVSTSGSKGVQPQQSSNPAPSPSGFSIHKRIEGGATQTMPKRQPQKSLVSVSTSGSKGVQPGDNYVECFS